MLKFRKIIGAFLILTLLVCSLASCKKTPEKLIDKADKALENTAYVVDVKVEYSSEDDGMESAIAAFSKPSMKIYVDGDKFYGRMDINFDGMKNYVSYTYVDGTLYTEWREDSETVQNKQQLGDADKSTLTESYGAGANISPDDFEKVSVKSSGKVSVITCETIKDDALIALVNSIESEFEAAEFNADAALKNAKLEIEVENGKYNVTTLTCLFYITTPVDTYSVEMNYSCKFDYDTKFEIVAPDFD